MPASEARVGLRYHFETRFRMLPSPFPSLSMGFAPTAQSDCTDRTGHANLFATRNHPSRLRNCFVRSRRGHLADFYGPLFAIRVSRSMRHHDRKKKKKRPEKAALSRGRENTDLPKSATSPRIPDARRRSVHCRLERRAVSFFLRACKSNRRGKAKVGEGIMTRRCFLRKRLIDNRSRCGEITYASARNFRESLGTVHALLMHLPLYLSLRMSDGQTRPGDAIR